jgi:hypothetical protein
MAKHKQIKEQLANQGEAARVRIKSFETDDMCSCSDNCMVYTYLSASAILFLSLDHKHYQDGI